MCVCVCVCVCVCSSTGLYLTATNDGYLGLYKSCRDRIKPLYNLSDAGEWHTDSEATMGQCCQKSSETLEKKVRRTVPICL